MSNSGMDIINEMASSSSYKKVKTSKLIDDEIMQSKAGAEVEKKTKISFKKDKIRRVFKGSHIPESLAIKIENKSRDEGVSESFLIQKIIEDWFNKYE